MTNTTVRHLPASERPISAATVPVSNNPAAATPALPTRTRVNTGLMARPALVAGGGAPHVTSATAQPSRQDDPISQFIELEMEARQCPDLDALRYAIVNATRQIASFEQAFLVEPAVTCGWSITRGSSVAHVDQNAPLVRALSAWLAHPRHADHLNRCEPRQTNLEQEWSEWGLPTEPLLFPQALWLPIKSRDGRMLAALLALRREPWRPQHVALLPPLAGAYGHAWDALLPRGQFGLARAKGVLSKARLGIAASVVAIAAAFLPVPLSALAPSEVVAIEPVLVTAPIDGVVKDVLAPPGAWVEKGAPIIKFVDVKLRNDVEVASRNVAVAEARYFKFVQSATANQKDMQELASAKAELEIAKAESAYASEVLDRSEVKAQNAGLLIYAAKSDWVGKPVTTGERLLEIGNPARIEMKIELPVSDAIVLQAGSRVSMFLDGDPLRAIDGTITRTSYRPALSADQQLVFRLFAKFDDDPVHRIGLRGVARVSGEQVPLWFYLLRKPIAAVRQRVGL